MTLQIINRHIEEYQLTWRAMRAYTDKRDANSDDQIWLVQHPAVFTQGLAGKPEHILDAGTLAVVQSDRGGQVTYHGLGQLVVYVLLDLARANLNLRQLVSTLEQAVISTLTDYRIAATTRQQAPGVYVDNAKICSIGLRIRRGYSYHGLALNVDMDLKPFAGINPCGVTGMPMTQLKAFVSQLEFTEVEKKLSQHLLDHLSLNARR